MKNYTTYDFRFALESLDLIANFPQLGSGFKQTEGYIMAAQEAAQGSNKNKKAQNRQSKNPTNNRRKIT